MLTVSPRWAPALATDHGMVARVRLLYGDTVVADDVPFTDGSVSVDRGSETRRSLSLTVPDPADFPFAETDAFSVYGHEVYVERGIQYADGSTESVPLGFFVITEVSGDIHAGPLSITAAGRELRLKREVFETATSTAGYTDAAAFIRTYVEQITPAGFVNASSSAETPLATRTWDAGAEIWPALVEVATSVGAELFCDAYGTFRLRDIPDIATAPPVWTVDAGEGGTMVSAEMSVSADGVYNRVRVVGENAEDGAPPVAAEARVTDPADPLRYGGRFGRVTKHYSSSLVTTTDQAQGTANALLRKYRAPNRTVALSSIPNPALDAGDCIRVVYGGDVAPELHLVQSFTLSLAAGGDFTIATVAGKDDTA